MFTFTKKKQSQLDLELTIQKIFSDLMEMDSDSKEYAAAAEQLAKLMELQKKLNPSWRPSPDALLGAVASVTTIVLILNYEKFNVLTSKAVGFIGRAKM